MEERDQSSNELSEHAEDDRLVVGSWDFLLITFMKPLSTINHLSANAVEQSD